MYTLTHTNTIHVCTWIHIDTLVHTLLCSLNKDLCYVSYLSVPLSILPSHVLHSHNLSLSCDHSTAHNSCGDNIRNQYSLHGPATYNMTKVFVKTTMSFLLCTNTYKECRCCSDLVDLFWLTNPTHSLTSRREYSTCIMHIASSPKCKKEDIWCIVTHLTPHTNTILPNSQCNLVQSKWWLKILVHMYVLAWDIYAYSTCSYLHIH